MFFSYYRFSNVFAICVVVYRETQGNKSKPKGKQRKRKKNGKGNEKEPKGKEKEQKGKEKEKERKRKGKGKGKKRNRKEKKGKRKRKGKEKEKRRKREKEKEKKKKGKRKGKEKEKENRRYIYYISWFYLKLLSFLFSFYYRLGHLGNDPSHLQQRVYMYHPRIKCIKLLSCFFLLSFLQALCYLGSVGTSHIQIERSRVILQPHMETHLKDNMSGSMK